MLFEKVKKHRAFTVFICIDLTHNQAPYTQVCLRCCRQSVKTKTHTLGLVSAPLRLKYR